MEKLPIMPDLPIEYIEYYKDSRRYMIFDQRLFIKEHFKSDIDIEPYILLAKTNIEGCNTPKKIFVSEDGEFYYECSQYLKNHKNLYDATKGMTKHDLLLLYKKLLTNLQIAHQNGLILYDIKSSNYLVSENNNPIFCDFDNSFYNGLSTSKDKIPPIFDLKYFGIDKEEYNEDDLILNDKILALRMLINNLVGPFHYFDFQVYYEQLKNLNIFSNEVKDYLDSILIRKQIPEKQDYFIDNLINPLLDKYSLSRKKN